MVTVAIVEVLFCQYFVMAIVIVSLTIITFILMSFYITKFIAKFDVVSVCCKLYVYIYIYIEQMG